MKDTVNILFDAIKQIKILNANKDHDIAWLCVEAIKLVENENANKTQTYTTPET